MEIKKYKKDGATVLCLNGEITLNTAPKLRDAFDKLYKKGVRKLVLDFKDVTYIDSFGLGILIQMLQTLGQNHGALAIANMDDKIKNLFEIAKIDMMMSIYNNQEDAVLSLR